MVKKLTTRQAAEVLGVSPPRIRQLVLDGELPAEKFGRDLVILESDLAKVKRRPLGRPPQKKKKANADVNATTDVKAVLARFSQASKK